MSIMQIIPHLACEINQPAALSGESLHSLPPYAKTPAYPVDAYPACPENWMRAEAPNGAFFVGVKKNKGLWLDFNACQMHSHEVAIVLSIQGINPITGTPSGEPKLEQFPDEKVPQNYLATTGTPHGHFWLDGFRGADGEVRQYVFTEETIRGIAAQVVGNDRTFSIGVAFFLSKESKPPERLIANRLPFQDSWEPASNPGNPSHPSFGFPGPFKKSSHVAGNLYGSGKGHTYMRSCMSARSSLQKDLVALQESGLFEDAEYCMDGNPRQDLVETKKLEIAAGARIKQQVYKDPKSLDFWNAEPASILYINYAEESLVKQIRSKGRVGSQSEGPLAGLKVGN